MLPKEINNSPDSVNFPSLVDCRPHLTGFIFDIMETKKCTKCGEVKLLIEFHKQKSGKGGIKPTCKKCCSIYIDTYHKTKDGLIALIYNNQLRSSKYRSYDMPDYTKEQLSIWIYSQPSFEQLFMDWTMSGNNRWLTPSPDRLNDYLPYTLDNLRLVTWKDNNSRGHSDMRNGINNKQSKSVIGVHKMTGEVIKYYSTIEASRQTGIDQGSISKCCSGARSYNSAGGYKWKFKH